MTAFIKRHAWTIVGLLGLMFIIRNPIGAAGTVQHMFTTAGHWGDQVGAFVSALG